MASSAAAPAGCPDLQRLAVLAGRSGLAFTPERLPFLSTRARAVMAWAGLDDWPRWLGELERSAEAGGELFAAFQEALQVHHTEFFRYPAHHRLLTAVVLPAHRAAGSGPLRVLSVGCATGQEPYSLAMTLAEAGLGPGAAAVVGVEVGRAAVAAAGRGEYGPASVATVPPRHLARYFEPRGSRFVVGPTLRAMVELLHRDIRADLGPGRFDLVVCCNVLLYLVPAVRSQVLERLTALVRPGGFLLLGPAEGVRPSAEHFRSVLHPAGVLHRRREGR